MRLLVTIDVPDKLLEQDWREYREEAEATMTLAEWRTDYAAGVLDYISGCDTRPEVTYRIQQERVA